MIAVGEIRDRATAEVAFQASLTGHLVLTTFHAGRRFGGRRPAQRHGNRALHVASGLLAVVAQALPAPPLRLRGGVGRPRGKAAPGRHRVAGGFPVGCSACEHAGYRGRIVLAEMLVPEKSEVSRAILFALRTWPNWEQVASSRRGWSAAGNASRG